MAITKTDTPLKIAIVGSGYMGGGIAQVLALAGHQVVLSDVSAEVAEKSRQRLLSESDAFITDELFEAGSTKIIDEHLTAAESIEAAVADADFIEEAVPEKLELKREILARVSAAARPEAIIASNTSTISIGAMADAVDRPERFIGVHFSNPSPFIPGVEVIPHETTAEDTIAKAEQVVQSTGKETARIKDVTGFVLNRLQYTLFEEATRLVDEGVATVEDIDTIVRTTFGFRLPFFGPFAIADMAGLDVYAFCYDSLHAGFPDRFETPKVLADLVEAGKLGTKSGAGFLNVPSDATPELVAYRNKAYVKMQKLLDELGPAPLSY